MSYIGNSPGADPTNKIEQGNSSVEVIDTGTGRIEFTTDGTKVAEIDASGNMKFDSGYGSVATVYGCRAWVNFDGTGTVAIRDSGNVSSITDNGTGDYTVNFTNALTDANYSYAPGIGDIPLDCNVTVKNLSTSSIEIYVYRIPTSALTDASQVSIAVVR